MELQAYIDSLIKQGLSDAEIATKIQEFKANQTTDEENFQQDGVAGADAPSVSAAPLDMDFSLEDTFLEPQKQTADISIEEPEKRISTRLSGTERQQARAEQKDLVDDKQEEFDVEKELRTADDAFISSVKKTQASLLEIPAWLNRKKFLIEKQFMSDEKKKEFDNLSAEEQDAFIQNKYSKGLPVSFVPGVGAIPKLSIFSKEGQEAAEKVRKEAEEIEKNLIKYDTTITQAFRQGNLKEGATRLLTQVVGTLPSIAQAMIPYAGIPSIFAGQAAEAQREAIYEEGKKIDFKQTVYSDVVGASEALLELTTKKIGKSLFKNLIGKPKELIEKSIRDVGLGIVKAGGAEGLSETSTLAINKFAESKYYNEKGLFEMDEAKWDEFWAEAGDTFLIGMATGKGMSATGAAGGITRNAIGNRSVKKSLDKTSVNEISEAFVNENIDNDVVELSRNDFAERRLDLELKRKVEANELTLEKSEQIKNNFNNARQAVKIADGLDIGDKLINETVGLIQERNKVSEKIKSAGENRALVSEEIKRLKQIDTRLSNISVENKINIQTEKVTDIISGLDKINIEIAENQEQADQIAKDKNLSKKASTTDGFILQNPETGEQTIVINKQASVKARAMNVAGHELGHALLFNTVLKSPETAENLAEALKVELNKIDTSILKDSAFKNRLELYKNDPSAIIAEETLTLFSDALATGQIQYNETVFTKIGDFVRRLLQQAGLSKIEFNTGKDVFNFIKDYNKSIVKGKLTKAQQKLATEAATGTLVGQTVIDKQAVDTFKESKSQEDSKTKQILDAFTGPAENKKYNTKAEFETSPDYLNAYNYFTEPNPSLDARINSVAAGKGVDFIDVQKVKDNLSLRFVKNFDISKNSLFGWMLGKNPALDFAVLDVIKEETAKAPTVATTTAEGATIDIADDVSIEDQIDTAMEQQTEAPRSALKQELQKQGQPFVDQALEDAIETNTIEILEGAKPEFTDAALVPFLKQASQQKSFKQIKNKIGDAMTFLKDNDNYKTLFHSKNLPISVLVAMERNVPISDRIFTGEPTRLTTQDQINKAVNEGDFYVENEKTGPSKYPRKKPTLEQLEKFFNVPAINPVTGKRSGLKGTRKDGLVNAISFGLFRDITPSVMRKLDKPQAEIAKTAEKLIVDPDIKFSKSYNKKTKLKQKSEATYLTLLDIVGAKFEINGNTLVYEFVDSPSYEFLGGDVIDPLVSSDGSIIGASGVEIAEGAKTMLGNTRQNFVEANEVVSNFKDPRVVNLENIDFWKNYNFISKASTKKEKINPKLSIEENANIVNDRIIDYRLRQEGIDPNTLIKFSKGLPVDQGFELQEKSKFIFNTSEEVFKSKPNITFKEFEAKMRSSFISNNIKNQYLKQNLISLTKASAKGTSGNLFEYYTWHKLNNVETLRRFGIKNLLPKTWNSQIDIEAINLNGDAIGIEVKKDFKDRMGSSSLFIPGASNYTIESGKYKNKTVKIAKNIVELINKNKDLEKVLTDFLNNSKKIDGVVFDKDLGFPFTTITNSKKESTDLRDKLNRPDLVSIDIPISQVKKHYSNKVGSKGQGVNYIIIADEIFSLNNNSDIQDLNLNNLDVEAEINLRIKPSSARNRKSDNKFIESFNLTAEYGFKTKPENGIKFSKSIQTKFSKSLNAEFNRIIERSTKGKIKAGRVLSQTEAIMEGAGKGRFDVFIRPAAEDFVGLLYKTLGKGKQGDADMVFYKKTLLDPFARAMAEISADRISLLNDYKVIVENLKVPGEKGIKGLFKKSPLKKKVGDTGFTAEQAVRTYVWTKQGMEIPGLSEGQLKKLLKYVKENPRLITFGNQLININKGDGYAKPSESWLSGTIGTDILEGLNTTKRSKYLKEWQNNVDVIFSQDNLNKLQAAYGKPYVDAMKNVLQRMKTGRNRVGFSGDTITQRFTDFIAQATGSIMFLNSRSSVLQTISLLNFINFGDNNVFAAGKAFANQKQYWKDFSKLFNSDFLKDRRAGLRINVIERDIATAAKKGGIRAVTAKLLQAGFTPTQIADSFAIAAGGSTFYRNRVKTYEKEVDADGNKVYTKEQAEQKAFQDFRETAEESQQSSRPDKISQEQASGLGRHVLAFANTPAQYARIIKKAALDLKNGRGDAKTNISKIVYYTFAQNIIFNTLQQAIFATAFDDELEVTEEKSINLANGMANSLLRGMGVYPAVGAAIKDAAIKIYTEKQKKKPEFEKAAIQLLNIAPPLGSKYRKIAGGLKAYDFTTVDAAIKKGISLDNPAIRGGARITEGLTNLPLDRLLIKLDNIQGALDQDNENWQRVGMGLGWQDWQLGIESDEDKKERGRATKIKRREVERREVKRR